MINYNADLFYSKKELKRLGYLTAGKFTSINTNYLDKIARGIWQCNNCYITFKTNTLIKNPIVITDLKQFECLNYCNIDVSNFKKPAPSVVELFKLSIKETNDNLKLSIKEANNNPITANFLRNSGLKRSKK